MAKTNSVSILIHALTKAEKRYFKLYATLQQGEKDYIALFDILEKDSNSESAKKLFLRARPAASYAATCKYLYKVITDCLLQMRLDQDKKAKMISGLLKAEILFEKSLYDQAFRQLKIIQDVASLHEQHVIQLWATKLELSKLQLLNFAGLSESALIRQQAKVQEILKREKLITDHSALYGLLSHRLSHKGNVRSKKQKDELNDLVMSELSLNNNPLSETFESAKTHLLFQAQYFLSVNDHGSALKTFYELNELFEDNEYIWVNAPEDYISSIEGIVDTLHAIRKNKEIGFFLNKLVDMKSPSAYTAVRIESVVFIYKTATLLDAGDFQQAKLLHQTMERSLFSRLLLLDIIKQAQVYMYASLIYFAAGDINKCYELLNQIISKRGNYDKLPLFRTFRLLNILVHYELGNHDYILSEVRSIKRELPRSTAQSYLLEKTIFWFVQQALPADLPARKKLWAKVDKQFEAIRNERYEQQILRTFDFALWIKAKLYDQSFTSIVSLRP
jgi:hypothetical protein